MLFSNYLTFVYIAGLILLFNLSKVIFKNTIIRSVVLLGVNTTILLSLFKEHSLIVLLILSLLVYSTGEIIREKSSKTLLFISLFSAILFFSIRNYSIVQELFSIGLLSLVKGPVLSVQKIGLSYILFRYVHWLVESYRKTIHSSSVLSFLNYIFFFPTILAGPIDTYNNYRYWEKNNKVQYSRALFFTGISRIFIGAVKTIGIVPFIILYATDYTLLLEDFSPLIAVFLSLVAYSAYIYLDFSGYSDIAIGMAYMLGIKTPENFNNPYVSHNLSEFWKRWHMTFSLFLRLYVFKPFIKFYNSILGTKHRMPVSILCYLSTFTVCGIWHGDTLNFVYWGLWHGVGLSLDKLWTTYAKPKFSWSKSKTYHYSSVFVTFVYVTIGWVFFHYNMEQLVEIIQIIL